MIKVGIFKEGSVIGEYRHDDKLKEITIGRAPGCNIRLDDPAVSRLHSLMILRSGQWSIEKRTQGGSLLVNGSDVLDAPLLGGEEIAIDKFTLRVEIQDASGSAKASEMSSNSLAAAGAVLEGEKTKFASTAVNAVFRFEPGSASVSEFSMKGDLAVFGRASNCDVILTDKKASRKHLEVRRQGLAFFIKDLNSANGSLLNGAKLTESELSAGDQIEVGENKFTFTVENQAFFDKKDEFMPLPMNLTEAAPLEDDGYDDQALQPSQGYQMPAEYSAATAGGAPQGFAQGEGADTTGLGGAAPVEKSLLKRFWVWYKAQPPFRRYLVIFLILAGGGVLFGEDQATKKKAVTVKRDATGKKIRTYETLSKEKQAIVKKVYAELLAAHEKREFAKMLDAISKITALLDEYKEVKFFEQVAKKGLDDQEKAEAERKQREKLETIARAVEALENKGRPIFEKALKNPSARPELRILIQEIYSKSPSNSLASEWDAAIKRKEQEEEQEKKIAEEKRKLRERAEAEFKQVEQIFAQNRYIDALAAADQLPAIGYSENGYLDRIKKFKDTVQAKLDSVLAPLFQDAGEQRKEGGDLVRANEIYKQILSVDAQNKIALNGMEAIRQELHMRAKRMYADALLAESISELSNARELFQQCARTAPDNDTYKTRCKNKLQKYDVLR